MLIRRIETVALLVLCLPLSGRAELETLPIQTVTVFKDGHAFVEMRGEVALDEQGCVSIGNLPSPVMGTFWTDIDDSHPGDANASELELRTVTYQQEDVVDPSPIQSVDGLLHANLGKRVRFLFGGKEVQGRIRKAELGGKMIMVESVTGFRIFPVAQIESLDFPSQSPLTHSESVRRQPVLKLSFRGKEERPQATVVRVMYLQKGIRWIPSYRIVLRKDGFAEVRLQATLINELDDLQDAEVKLVVGVPSFITNFQTRDVVIEVERQVQGEVDDVVGDGEATKRVFFSDKSYPDWYWQAGWPAWWQRLNPSTSVKWQMRIPAAGSTTFGVDWHYLWR